MATQLDLLKKTLKNLANPEKASILQRFFKTGPGEYGEGDVFIGIVVPELRKLVREYTHLSIPEIKSLVQSRIHEERLLGLLLLVQQYKKGDSQARSDIFEAYCQLTNFINNWDLVDLSAEHIIGEHLHNRGKDMLHQWSHSKNLWKRRISVIATFNFIKKGEFKDTLDISESLLEDEEDLIHKAVGWMLREIGKRDLAAEERFLKKHYKSMPRTMLRYAIERFPEGKRQAYLKGKI